MIDYKLAQELKDAGFPQLNHMLEWELDKQVLHGVGYHLTADDPDEVYESGQLINKARYTSIFGREWILSEDGLRNTVYIPTLSELIEACIDKLTSGGGFVSISLHYNWTINTRDVPAWTAVFKGAKGCQAGDISEFEIMESGQSPEEAVAKLWLALNKKQDGSEIKFVSCDSDVNVFEQKHIAMLQAAKDDDMDLFFEIEGSLWGDAGEGIEKKNRFYSAWKDAYLVL